MKKRILFLLLCSVLICSFCAKSYAMPILSSKAACVMEVLTGRVLYAQNADARLPMASTTKIMTALLVLENGNLDNIVSIPEQAVGVQGSSIYLKKGEQFSRKSLLYALMLESGNDVATALALDVSGSINDFAQKMNVRAKELGARNTHFVNPHGLPSTEHYTTAYDLALIAATALRIPVFRKIVSTKIIVIHPQTQGVKRTLQNHNKLLWQFDGACGVKTGYTKAAGRCLVGAAMRDGKQVVSVVLNDPVMWEDTCTLLNTALDSLKHVKLKLKEDVIGSVNVIHGLEKQVGAVLNTDLIADITDQEQARLTLNTHLLEFIRAPVQKGCVIGYISAELDGISIGKAEIIADRDVLENTFMYQLERLVKLWVGTFP